MLKRTLAIGLTLGIFGSPVLAQNDAEKVEQPVEDAVELPKLFIGDKAPGLHISKWLKGDEIKEFEKGKTYVVEFWATWCGPCIAGMPHISKLQEEYKDKGVTMIGVNIWERQPENVPQWMEDRGNELMKYTVAMQQDTKMADEWMEPAGQNGIPSAFIVDKTGHIAWIGHPMSMDEPLKKIVEGTFDVRTARAEAIEAKRKELIEQRKMEQFQARSMDVMTAAQEAFQAGDMATAAVKIDELIALDPPERMRGQLVSTRFRITVTDLGDAKAAYEFLKKNRASVWDDAQLLNSVSWTILTAPEIDDADRDIDLALAWADRACDLTDYEDASILDTLAKAYFDNSQIGKAVEFQRKAVDAASGDLKTELQERLDEYEAEMKVG